MKADTSIRQIQLLTCHNSRCTRIHSTASCRVNSSSVQDQRSNRPSSRETSRSQDGATEEIISHLRLETSGDRILFEVHSDGDPAPNRLINSAGSFLDISGLQCATVSNVKAAA